MTIGLSSLYNEIKNGNTKVFSNNTVYNITFYHVIGRKIFFQSAVQKWISSKMIIGVNRFYDGIKILMLDTF